MLGLLVVCLVVVGSLETSATNLGPHPQHETHVVIKPEVSHHPVEPLHLLQEHHTGESRSKTR